MHEVEDLTIVSEGHDLRIRRYRPSPNDPLGTVVYFHSGGWVVGDVEGADVLVRHLALRSRCEYLNVGYRLAPENQYPAAVVDARAALLFAAGLGRPVVVHGDSSGGNLAAGAAQWARDTGLALAHHVVVYPVTDHDFTRPSYTERADAGLLSTQDMAWFWDTYAPTPTDRSAPDLSPLRGDLTDIAPATVVTAEFDPLRDEGRAYASALAAAGVPVRAYHVGDAFHGFFALPGVLDRADQYIAVVADAIRVAVDRPGTASGAAPVTDRGDR